MLLTLRWFSKYWALHHCSLHGWVNQDLISRSSSHCNQNLSPYWLGLKVSACFQCSAHILTFEIYPYCLYHKQECPLFNLAVLETEYWPYFLMVIAMEVRLGKDLFNSFCRKIEKNMVLYLSTMYVTAKW